MFSSAITALGNKNDKTFKIKLGNTDKQTYTDAYSKTNQTYAITGASATSSYSVVLEVSDYFTTVTETVLVSTAFATMHISEDAKHIAMGQMYDSSHPETLQVNGGIYGTCTNAQYWMPTDGAGFTSDQYGNLKHKRSTNTDVWQMKNSAGTVKASYNWETGIWDAGATKDGGGTNIITGYSHAGGKDGVNAADVGSGKAFQRSGLYSFTDGTWYNLINVRHRNGEGDGTNYGMQLLSTLTSANTPLRMRKQVNNSWSSWEDIYRAKSLYENSSGNTGTITLSESAANFTFLEIFYLSTSDSSVGYSLCSAKAWGSNGKSVWLSTGTSDPNNCNIKFSCVKINGTSISKPYGNMEMDPNEKRETNYIGITKVIGWR